MSFLPSILLPVHSTSNNANGNKWEIFPGMAWYYGDNDLSFDFIARSDTPHDLQYKFLHELQ